MIIEEIRALHDALRAQAPSPEGFRREETINTVRFVDQIGRNSFIDSTRLNEATADEAIAGEIAYFDNLGHDVEWKTYGHDAPGDLIQRLERHGFEPQETEAFVVLDLLAAPARLLEPVQADVRRVAGPNDLGDFVVVQDAIWNKDHRLFAERLAREMRAAPSAIAVYVAYVDNVPVSAARMDFSPNGDFAGLWGGSTLPPFRGRGLYTALVAVRVQEARRRGARFATVDALPTSRPILERRGFCWVSNTVPCVWRCPRHGESGGVV